MVQLELGALLAAAGAYHCATGMSGLASARIVQGAPLLPANDTAVMSVSTAIMANTTLKILPPNLWLFRKVLVIDF
jgi:hypothetical protein